MSKKDLNTATDNITKRFLTTAAEPQREKPVKKKPYRFQLVIPAKYEDYIKTMAGANGTSVNSFIIKLIEDHKEQNSETYNKIKELLGK